MASSDPPGPRLSFALCSSTSPLSRSIDERRLAAGTGDFEVLGHANAGGALDGDWLGQGVSDLSRKVSMRQLPGASLDRFNPNACPRSSIRSAGCSSPTDTRSRFCAVRLPGPSLELRCSMRLSDAAEGGGAGEEASCGRRRRARPRGRRGRGTRACRRRRDIWRPRDVVTGVRFEARVVDGLDALVRRQEARHGAARSRCARACAPTSVRMPRSTSQELNGEATPPRSLRACCDLLEAGRRRSRERERRRPARRCVRRGTSSWSAGRRRRRARSDAAARAWRTCRRRRSAHRGVGDARRARPGRRSSSADSRASPPRAACVSGRIAARTASRSSIATKSKVRPQRRERLLGQRADSRSSSRPAGGRAPRAAATAAAPRRRPCRSRTRAPRLAESIAASASSSRACVGLPSRT